MYTAPEVRELGTVSAFTLGSSHTVNSTTKANNSAADLYDALPADATKYGYGSPCSTYLPNPIPPFNCS